MTRAKKNGNTGPTLIPAQPTLAKLRSAAATCKACDLWERATQTVFGEGNSGAPVMLVGEQPGDREDILGHPFVGPAGKLLDKALVEAGIDRNQVYVTNVVKHFNWAPEARGKRRIHKKPRYYEIAACRPWLDAEIEVLRPEVVVCLGATAAQSLLGKNFSVLRSRGEFVASPLAPYVMATVHPSSILRAVDHNAREQQMQAFVSDLQKVARVLTAARKAA
jgi:DNA polymerase